MKTQTNKISELVGARLAEAMPSRGMSPSWTVATRTVAALSNTVMSYTVLTVQAESTYHQDLYGVVGARLFVVDGDPSPSDTLDDEGLIVDEVVRQINASIDRAEQRRASADGVVRFLIQPGARAPVRSTSGASGYDLVAPERVRVPAGRTVVVHSGVRFQLPDTTWEAQVRPRSSFSRRGLITALGTVDSDYRGVVGATICNCTSEDVVIEQGERFAQIVFARVAHPKMVQVDALSETERGSGGFGSTGR